MPNVKTSHRVDAELWNKALMKYLVFCKGCASAAALSNVGGLGGFRMIPETLKGILWPYIHVENRIVWQLIQDGRCLAERSASSHLICLVSNGPKRGKHGARKAGASKYLNIHFIAGNAGRRHDDLHTSIGIRVHGDIGRLTELARHMLLKLGFG